MRQQAMENWIKFMVQYLENKGEIKDDTYIINMCTKAKILLDRGNTDASVIRELTNK